MGILISFCIGIILITVSRDLGDILQIIWVSPIIDVLGGIMIGISIYLYMEQKNKDKINLNERLEVLKRISDVIVTEDTFNGMIKQLDEIKIMNERLSQNQMVISNNLEVFIQLYDSNAYSKEEQRKIVDSVGENFSILVNAVNELNKKIETNNSEVIGLIKNVSPEIVKSVEESTDKEIECIDEINKSVKFLNDLPKEMFETLDQYTKKVDQYVQAIVPQIEHLSDDLENLESKRKEDFGKVIKEIRDTNEQYNNDLAKKIEELSKGYNQFKSLTDEMIKQMTKMAEEDYEIMKGLIND